MRWWSMAVVFSVGVVLTGCVPAVSGTPGAQAETVVLEPLPAKDAQAPAPTKAVDTALESFDTAQHWLEEASSLWVIVNKARPLSPLDYAPGDLVAPPVPSTFSPLLRADATEALVELFEAAGVEGLDLVLHSSYRSYPLQKRIKADSVARLGQEVSDARSARAGHSEHQTGLVVDLAGARGSCTLQECFAHTPEGEWLWKNSWRFGYVLRYLEGKTPITGYIYEPWHFRYVGLELATEIHNQGYPTLEEFFGLDPAPDYLD